MSATPRHASARRMPHLSGIDPVHLAVRTLYGAAGMAAAVSLYRRMLEVIGDPLPSAIMTLMGVMLVIVVSASKDRPS